MQISKSHYLTCLLCVFVLAHAEAAPTFLRYELVTEGKQKARIVEVFEMKDRKFWVDGRPLRPEFIAAKAHELQSWKGRVPSQAGACAAGTYQFKAVEDTVKREERGCLGSARYRELAKGFEALK